MDLWIPRGTFLGNPGRNYFLVPHFGPQFVFGGFPGKINFLSFPEQNFSRGNYFYGSLKQIVMLGGLFLEINNYKVRTY